MVFHDWLLVYDRDGGTEALDKMIETAQDFNDWRNIFYRAPPESQIKKTALLQMMAMAEDFGECLNVCQGSTQDENSFLVAMCKMMELADQPKDVHWTKDNKSLQAIKLKRWEKIFYISPPKSEVEVKAIKEILELMLAIKSLDKQ